MLSPKTAPADVPKEQAAARTRYLRELDQGLPIDIHYHTFTPESLEALLRAAGFIGGTAPRFKLLAQADRYPPGRDDGIGILLRRVDAIERENPVHTFALEPSTAGIAPLPLVCPISLSPLRLEKDAEVRRELIAASNLRYPFVANRPSLLPPRAQSPERSWGDRSWRTTRLNGEPITGHALLEGPVRSHLDEPEPHLSVDPLCFFVRGWLWLGRAQSAITCIEAWSGETLLGKTSALYVRPDVTTAHWLAPDARTGFELFAHHPQAKPGEPFEVEIRARFADGSQIGEVFRTTVNALSRDYRKNHFGVLLDQTTTAVQRRANIFTEGPSTREASGEIMLLLRRYLPAPPSRVLDVGCGVGAYGQALIADGYDWFGVEIDAEDCRELARLNLPFRQTDGRSLPFNDCAFESALCLDVLEHIDDPAPFLREIHRVAPRQLIVSVPNCELLGYLWDHLATPWHMLEGDHKNFFTRWSLGALLRQFYRDVELRFHGPYPLRTIEATPLYYHLFAVAKNPR